MSKEENTGENLEIDQVRIHRWEKHGNNEYHFIPKNHIDREIGELVHCCWSRSPGLVWRLKKVLGDIAILVTPKTNKEMRTNINNLLYSRGRDPYRPYYDEDDNLIIPGNIPHWS